MKKATCLLLLLFTSSFSMNIDEIVDKALENNYDLKSIEKSLQVANKNIELSTKWKDPVLTLGINDIHFDEPFTRDAEAMQASYIGFSQVLPLGEKLNIKKDIAKKDKKLIALSLEDKKLKLKAKIYEASYNILILEKKLTLLNSFEDNIKKLEKLSTALYKYGKASQNEILNAKIAFSNISIQKQNLKNMIDNLYLRLEQITYSKINTIESDLNINKIVLNMNIKNHPKIKIAEEKIRKFHDIARLETENEKSDIKVNISYFSRDSKFQDYANISVNIPLSLYKTQRVKSLRSKIKASEISSKLEALKQNFKTELLILQNGINNSFKNYKVIEETIIPLKRKMQENIENYNSFSSIKPQMAITNLNELIAYEIKLIDQIKDYYTYYSKTKYYNVEVK